MERERDGRGEDTPFPILHARVYARCYLPLPSSKKQLGIMGNIVWEFNGIMRYLCRLKITDRGIWEYVGMWHILWLAFWIARIYCCVEWENKLHKINY